MARQITTPPSRRTLRTRAPRRGPAGLLRAAPAAVALALLASVPVAAQQETGEVRGTVVDVRRQAPVGLAAVSIPALDRRTVADAGGRFRFRDVPPGSYELRVRFLGYEAAVREVEVPAGGTRTVEVRVAPGPVELEELEVSVRTLTWMPGFRERRRSATGHFFTKSEIEDADPSYLTQLLRGREGVRIGLDHGAHGADRRYPQFYYRGPGRAGVFCRPVVFVDGEMMGPGRRYLRFNEIPPDEVLAMEVYYRERDVPENIEYEHRDPGSDADGPDDVAAAGQARGVGGSPGARQVLAAAGLENVFDRPVPQRDEDLDLSRTVLADLYDRPPRLEHCGAVFVWTRLYPHAEE
jgi:hypothetical protein